MKWGILNRLRLLTITCIATLFAACGDDGPYSDRVALYDLVTFDGNLSQGATFTFQRRDDSPMITLTAKGVKMATDQVKQNDRLIIGYYPEAGEAYKSDNIQLISVTKVNQDTIRFSPAEEIVGWDRDPIYLNSLWRSGKYLNMYLRVEYSSESRKFRLVADESTLGDEYPQLYLMHDMFDAPESFSRRAYASFDISSVWDNPKYKGVVLHINDSNIEKEIYTFTK